MPWLSDRLLLKVNSLGVIGQCLLKLTVFVVAKSQIVVGLGFGRASFNRFAEDRDGLCEFLNPTQVNP